MKNWRDTPHLFANGKFRFKENNGREWELTPALSAVIGSHHTLIARPISDMSDEEWDKCYGINDDVERFLWKLSHGFLPEEFGDNPKNVIWRYENDATGNN